MWDSNQFGSRPTPGDGIIASDLSIRPPVSSGLRIVFLLRPTTPYSPKHNRYIACESDAVVVPVLSRSEVSLMWITSPALKAYLGCRIQQHQTGSTNVYLAPWYQLRILDDDVESALSRRSHHKAAVICTALISSTFSTVDIPVPRVRLSLFNLT